MKDTLLDIARRVDVFFMEQSPIHQAMRRLTAKTTQVEYAEADHADERKGIQHIDWKLPLDIPKPDQLPLL